MSALLSRLPVYLVLDCSGSMAGEPIEAVRMGVRGLLADLRGDPTALETVYLSVITFAGSAVQACPLTELALFQEPNLSAGGSTALGAALNLLMQCVDTEVRKPSKDQKGDWKPLILLMTDGVPTDDWESAADTFRTRRMGKVIMCAAGDQADPAVLKRLDDGGGIIVQLRTLQPDELGRFFKWVSSSVSGVASSVSALSDAASRGHADAANLLLGGTGDYSGPRISDQAIS